MDLKQTCKYTLHLFICNYLVTRQIDKGIVGEEILELIKLSGIE